MKNNQNRLSGLKYQLRTQKEAGKKEVTKKLSDEQREFIEEVLGYETKPWLYEITTKTIEHVRKVKSSIIRDIHYAKKRGQKKLYKRLKVQDKKTLDEYGIVYRRFKDRIIL